jgi:hypothetical protein
MNDKIVIGTKGKSDNGYVFYPYIKVFELKLPLKFKKLDSKVIPIFTKIKNYEY